MSIYGRGFIGWARTGQALSTLSTKKAKTKGQGRGKRGSLSDEKVRAIRKDCIHMPRKAVAEKHGVSKAVVDGIIECRNYVHVQDD